VRAKQVGLASILGPFAWATIRIIYRAHSSQQTVASRLIVPFFRLTILTKGCGQERHGDSTDQRVFLAHLTASAAHTEMIVQLELLKVTDESLLCE